jgi:Single-strand binding protein family
MPNPRRKRPTNPAPEPTHGRRLILSGRLRWLCRLPLGVSRHATVSTVPRFQGQGRPPGQATGRGSTVTEPSVSFAGNLTDHPEVRYTEGGIARAVFRVAVSGRRDQEASFFTVVVWRDQPSMPPSHCRRGAGSWSWVGSSSGAGRLRTAPLSRWSRSWPTSWGRACVGRRRPRPGRRGARSRRVPRRPGRRNERHPASWKLWLQDLALDSLETSAGIVGGWSSLGLLPHVRPQGGL